MKLFIDQGNSRIKWRFVAGSCSENGVGEPADLICFITLFLSKGRRLEAIILSSVASLSVREEFVEALTNLTGLVPKIARVKSPLLGVVCAYKDYSKLGVDRWLAMLAAFHSCGGECVVIDAGSALTVDVVDKGGQHKGGLLVPGLEVMRRSLYTKSEALSTPPLTYAQNWALGCDTVACVQAGLSALVRGLVGQIENFVGENCVQSAIFVAGGDAEFVAKLFERRVIVQQELVLDGLELVSCCPEAFDR